MHTPTYMDYNHDIETSLLDNDDRSYLDQERSKNAKKFKANKKRNKIVKKSRRINRKK